MSDSYDQIGRSYGATRRPDPRIAELAEHELGQVAAIPVPLPRDCSDGFLSAFWARPGAYLDPRVRANMSPFARGRDELVAPGLEQLAHELSNGTWDRLYGQLRHLEQLDLGHRILHAELG